jgi:hypothetical protein
MKQKDNVTFYFYRPYIDSFFSLVYILLSFPSQLYLLMYLFILHCVRHTFSHPRYLVPNWVVHLLLSTRTYFSCFYMVHPSFFFSSYDITAYLRIYALYPLPAAYTLSIIRYCCPAQSFNVFPNMHTYVRFPDMLIVVPLSQKRCPSYYPRSSLPSITVTTLSQS